MADTVTEDDTEEIKPSPWFYTWTKEFQLGEGSELLKQRWQAIGSFADTAKSLDVEPLVRLAIGSRQAPSPEWIATLEETFREEYPAFTASSNTRELQVLAACCLLHISQDPNNEAANLAALASATTSVAGQRKFSLPGDLPQAADEALRSLYLSAARRPKLSAGVQYKPLFEAAVQKARGQQDIATLIDALALAGAAATSAVNQNQSKTQVVVEALAHRLDQQDEELQMLWWLIAERSEDLACSFGDLADAARPLVLAKELASHTLLPPGPPTVRALLSRAKLAGNGKVALVEAVAAAPFEWLKAHVSSQAASPVTQPLHFAIARQLETGPGTAWVAGWAAATDLPQDAALSHLTLAELFYRERLLTRLLG
ncbi:GTPase-associated system all-helical protein GASH [Rhodoferax sp.]|uniref:GTPase-associated system all-helical protein GASH n=1 Tax=Rhodoferax sp. TaxID=50421 RepID=UPI001EC5BF57|nr:GTPase-associated system all-helical protein GASH [Rhodoferax sp.]MBT9504979.1 hypothetical protein [Rhodoferax sp.]